MQKLLGASVSFAIGLAFAIPGVCLLLFLAFGRSQPDLAQAWLSWLLAHAVVSPDVTAALIQGHPAAWVVGIVLTWLGWSSLQGARDGLRPEGESTGGEAQLELTTRHPRAGGLLEGRLRLLKIPEGGQRFRVEVVCRETSEAPRTRRTVFNQSQDVAAVDSVNGWVLPFRFELPAESPPSTAPANFNISPDPVIRWSIELCRADALIAVPSSITLSVGAAIESTRLRA